MAGSSLPREDYKTAIPQLSAKLNQLLSDNVIFNKNVITLTQTVEGNNQDYAYFKNLTAGYFEAIAGDFEYLSSREAYLGHLKTDVANIGYLDADAISARYANLDNFNALTGRVGDLEADHVSVADLNAANAEIGNLKAKDAEIEDLVAKKATIADLNAANAEIDTLKATKADISELEANYAHISNGVIDNAKIGYADVDDLNAHYANIDLANVNNAWIENGVVKDAAISDAQIIGVSANKLTAGTIDASKIDVTNLNADNLTVGTINGKRIGNESITLDKLAEEVPTKEYLDNVQKNLQGQIDGQIETWTGSTVPTLKNAPASSWSTAADKKKHVGDIYYVVNAANEADGYTYRFTENSDGTYGWTLIKDNQITKALQDIVDAQGEIRGIKQFDTQISSWKTDTDEELSSIKARTSTLETDMGTKISTTTFNELKQEVDENSATITSLSETVDKKADGSTVTTLTNTVNTVKQTADTNKSTIESLSKTVSDNETDIEKKFSDISQDLDGFKVSVGSTYTTTSDFTSYRKSNDAAVKAAQDDASDAKSSASASASSAANAASSASASETAAKNAQNAAQAIQTKADNGDFDGRGVKSTAVTYQVGTSGTTAPTGNWSTSPVATTAQGQYLWTRTVITYTDNTSSTSYSVAAHGTTGAQGAKGDKGDKGATGATGAAVVDVKPLYYLKSNATAPSKPTSEVTSTSTAANVWTTVVPTYQSGYVYFTCLQTKYSSGTSPQWSNVVQDNELMGVYSDLNTIKTTYVPNSTWTVEKEKIEGKVSAVETTTKEYTDGKITQEVKDRNSAIEAKADSINLSVDSKISNIQVGGRNYYGYKSDLQTDLSGLKNYNDGFSITTIDGKKCAHVTGALQTTKYLQSKILYKTDAMEEWTFSAEVKLSNIVRGTTNPMCEFYFSGEILDGAWRGFTVTKFVLDGVEDTTNKAISFDKHISDTKWHSVAVTAYFNYNGTSAIPNMYASIYLRDCTGDMYIRNVKFEKGNKATDWSPAPEDITSYADTQVEAAKAAIKVTTDGISQEVAKISSYKYVESSGSGWTLANIKTYAAEGHSENWNVKSTTNLRAGDTVYVTGKDTTRNCNIYIKTTVTKVNSATSFTGVSHGYEDILPVDAVKSTINQSPNSVKIKAEHVEIDGAAIFSNTDFKEAADAAYDAKNSATNAINNLQIGGKNLVWDSEWKNLSERWSNWGSPTTREIVTLNGKRWLHLVTTATFYQGYSQSFAGRDGNGEIKAGDKIVISYTAYAKTAGQVCTVGCHWNKADGTIASQNWFASSLTTTEQRYVSQAFTVPTDAVRFNVMIGQGNVAQAQELWISEVKVEKGTKATDWTPAPKDLPNDLASKNGTTIIDGGHITTGTIDASKATITNINADNITTGTLKADRIGAGTLSVGKLATATQTDISNGAKARAQQTVKDTRNDNQSPSWYITTYGATESEVREFKIASKIGCGTSTACGQLTTHIPWKDKSGGYPKQTFEFDGKQYWRHGTSDTAWSAWVDAYGTAVNSGKTATNYITYVDSTNGIRVYDGQSSNKNVNFAQLNSSGMQIYKGGSADTNIVASFGDGVYLYNETGPVASFTSGGTVIGGSNRHQLFLDEYGITGRDSKGSLTFQFSKSASDWEEEEEIYEYAGNAGTRYYTSKNPECEIGSIISKLTSGQKFKVRAANLMSSPKNEQYYTMDTYYTLTKGQSGTTEMGGGDWSIGYNGTGTLTFERLTPIAQSADPWLYVTIWDVTTTIVTSKPAFILGQPPKGLSSKDFGCCAVAEGMDTAAYGDFSHAQNLGTVTESSYQTAIGKYNNNLPDNAFELGNGDSDDDRSNALEIDWDGAVRSNYLFSTGWVYQRETVTFSRSAKPGDANMYPFLDVQTPKGDWAMATYGETLYLGSYVTDANYDDDTNTQSAYLSVNSSGVVNSSGGYQRHGKAYIATANFTKDNISIAKTSNTEITISAAKSGYTLIGVVGVDLSNASSSGVNVSLCSVFEWKASGSNILVQIRNNASSAAKIKLQVFCLYIAN